MMMNISKKYIRKRVFSKPGNTRKISNGITRAEQPNKKKDFKFAKLIS